MAEDSRAHQLLLLLLIGTAKFVSSEDAHDLGSVPVALTLPVRHLAHTIWRGSWLLHWHGHLATMHVHHALIHVASLELLRHLAWLDAWRWHLLSTHLLHRLLRPVLLRLAIVHSLVLALTIEVAVLLHSAARPTILDLAHQHSQ